MQAQVALDEGDTPRAQKLFKESAEKYGTAAASLEQPSQQELARFLAATQYYKGGCYPQALALCEKIRSERLPRRVRDFFAPFWQDVRERAAPDYRFKMRALLKKDIDEENYQNILDTFHRHPYIVSAPWMAYWRGWSCLKLNDLRAATLFFRDAWKFDPSNDTLFSLYLDSLCREGNFSQAWELLESRLKTNAQWRTFLDASVVRSRQAEGAAPAGVRLDFRREQVKLFEEFWGRYRALPADERSNSPRYLAPAVTRAWYAYRELNQADQGQALLDEWVALPPPSPRAYTTRGVLAYPAPAALADFRRAVELGADEVWPYYFLARHALEQGDRAGCAHFCDEALRRKSDPEVRDQLLEWQRWATQTVSLPSQVDGNGDWVEEAHRRYMKAEEAITGSQLG
jgi:tetratricopeptide (TPR) repeat protein